MAGGGVTLDCNVFGCFMAYCKLLQINEIFPTVIVFRFFHSFCDTKQQWAIQVLLEQELHSGSLSCLFTEWETTSMEPHLSSFIHCGRISMSTGLAAEVSVFYMFY